jgi:hypothetical protein
VVVFFFARDLTGPAGGLVALTLYAFNAVVRRGRDHALERHDLRQLAQMTGREPARGYRDRTVNDRMLRQRNSQLEGCLVRTTPL